MVQEDLGSDDILHRVDGENGYDEDDLVFDDKVVCL